MIAQFKLFPFMLLALLLTTSISQVVEIQLQDPFEENVESDFIINNITTVQTGWPGVPAAYQSPEDFYLLPALELGAQFVASQAVADELFTTSEANVTIVYSSVITPPASAEEDIVVDGDSDYIYAFDVELLSAVGETVRAQFTVVVDVNSVTYKVVYYNFDYLVSYEGEIGEMEVSFGYNNYEYNLFDWDSSADNSESGLNLENVVDAEALPEFGESFEYDPNLEANNWVQVNTTERLGNSDFLFLLKYGAEFVIEQAFLDDNFIVADPSQFEITYVYSVWERNITNGGTDFKFDIKTQSQEFQTVRLNFQLNYNANDSILNLNSWGIESIINIELDF